MARVDKLGGQWVIVRGGEYSMSEQAGASRATEETASSAREFWTGDGWAMQFGLAQRFALQEEAESYLVQHRPNID